MRVGKHNLIATCPRSTHRCTCRHTH